MNKKIKFLVHLFDNLSIFDMSRQFSLETSIKIIDFNFVECLLHREDK